MARREDYSKYFFIVFVVFMAVMVFLVIRPFIAALLAGIVLSYLFYPIYRWLYKKIKSKSFASLIACFIIVIILLLPLFFVLNALTKEAYVGYLTSKQKILTVGEVFKKCDPNESVLCNFVKYIGDFLDEPKVKFHLQNTVEKVASYIIDGASNLVFSIPRFVLNFFVMVFSIFYLFKDGPSIFSNLRKLLPLRDIYKRHLFEKFGKVTFAIVYGYIVVALIQGFCGALGFFIFGVRSPIIWGVVMAFAALIPFIGTSIIWVPAAFLKLAGGIITGGTGEIIGGVLFILYGVIIISGIDNVVRPKIIGDRARVHPVLILVGVLGGIYLLGFVGVLVGPLILALFDTFLKAYEQDRKAKK